MDVFSILRGILGLIVVTALAYFFSSDKKKIDWKLVIVGILLQFVFAFLVVKTEIGVVLNLGWDEDRNG